MRGRGRRKDEDGDKKKKKRLLLVISFVILSSAFHVLLSISFPLIIIIISMETASSSSYFIRLGVSMFMYVHHGMNIYRLSVTQTYRISLYIYFSYDFHPISSSFSSFPEEETWIMICKEEDDDEDGDGNGFHSIFCFSVSFISMETEEAFCIPFFTSSLLLGIQFLSAF